MTAQFTPCQQAAISEARAALEAHSKVQASFLAQIGDVMGRVALWAWEGALPPAGDPGTAMQTLRDDILTAVQVLFVPLARRGRVPLTERAVNQGTWPEAVFALVSADAHIGRTLLAAAARWHFMMGAPILPRMLAMLAGVDQSRIHGLVREGVLRSPPTRHAVTRPGRRVKGDETRVTATSALRWLKVQELAPASAELLGKPKRTRRRAM